MNKQLEEEEGEVEKIYIKFLRLLMYVQLIYSFFSLFAVGRREQCSNEGEVVAVDSIKDMKCFKCICQVSSIDCY